MDELNDNFSACFSLANLLRSADLCARETRWKRQVQQFMANKLTNCWKLYSDLHDGTYTMSRADHFTIMERGKLRTVKTINIRDRVVQRCVCDHILVPAIKGAIIVDNSSCLKGRGLSYAYDRVHDMVDKAPWSAWLIQFDFHDYFHTISKERLLGFLGRIIKDRDVLDLLSLIIHDDACGLELGSHVSQICAVYYPNDMDHDLAALAFGYHRYMDDGLIICERKDQIPEALGCLITWVDRLGLTLNLKKTVINRIGHPFVFCKMRFKKYNGGVRMSVRKEQTRRTVKHLKGVKRLCESGKTDGWENTVAACLGYINRGDADLSRLLTNL